MASMRPTYGRDARMRSWARFILDAATISIALVILRVLCTLLILLRISFDPAIAKFLEGPVLLEVLDRRGEVLLGAGVEILGRFDLLQQRGILALDERPKTRLEDQRLFHGNVVVVALVDREKRKRFLGHRQ